MQHTRAVLVTKDVKNKVWDTIKEIKTKDETGEWHGGGVVVHPHPPSLPFCLSFFVLCSSPLHSALSPVSYLLLLPTPLVDLSLR
jgi:hypothetical protein